VWYVRASGLLTRFGGTGIAVRKTQKENYMFRTLFKSSFIVLLLIGARSASHAQNVFTPGWLREDFWGNISGGVDGLVGDPRYPNTPDTVKWWNSFGPYKAGNNQGDNFGEAITGYVIPPTTGNYKFYLRSDDPSRLFISTDDKPANLGGSPIAEQTGCCNAFTDAEGTLSSTPIALTAGKKYYIQALHVEGGGDDYVQVAWRGPGEDLNSPPSTVIPAAYIGVDAPSAGASVTVTTQPSDTTATANSTASFTVGYTAKFGGTIVTSPETQDADAATDAAIVWFKNGVAIAGQSKATYTTPLLTPADDGAKFKAQISVPGAVIMSSEATVKVTADTVPPTIVKASGDPSLASVTINFDGAVDASTATNAANYSISPSISVSGAKLVNFSTVVLATAAQTAGTKYTLTVNNVKDLSGNVIKASTTANFFSAVFATGACSMSYFSNISGGIAGLQGDPRFPGSPDLTALLSDWEYPPYNGPWSAPASGNNEAGDNYGNTITGWFIPAKTGDYVFFTCSDDPSNLYLSTDDSPANKKLIAQETNWANPRQWVTSAGGTDPASKRSDQFTSSEWSPANKITLTAGKKYYMESQHTEGGGGDNVEVTFIMAGDPDPADGDASKLTGAVIGTTIPADGLVASTSPTGADITPSVAISAQLIAGLAKYDATTVTMKLDGNAVTPSFTNNGSATTITYKPASPYALGSAHQAEVDYPLADGSKAAVQWKFTVVKTQTKDSVGGVLGYVKGPGGFTADAGGHSGKPGDYAIDSTKNGGTWVDIQDVGFLNAAAPKDTLSMSLWVKKYDIANGSAFWAQVSKVTTGTDLRGYQAHIPWSDDTIYFDTGGCCDGTAQRISANISTFGDYKDDSFWTNWHHFVFTKKADQKNIYIDGKLFLNGSSADALLPAFTELGLLTDGVPGGDFMHGIIDDFAVYSTEVSAADAAKLAGGTSPKDLTGETLIAYWNFDDATPTGGGGAVTIGSITASGGKVTITWTGGGTLQSAASVTGPWADQAGTTSPATVPATGAAGFFRIKQ
jgi:hypothetical protein